VAFVGLIQILKSFWYLLRIYVVSRLCRATCK